MEHEIRKPTKPPPPPPPPPKVISPICSVTSLNRLNYGMCGSEYAESVASSIPYSTRSLQQPVRCASPTCYNQISCRSESGAHIGSSTLGSSSGYRTTSYCSPVQPAASSCCCPSVSSNRCGGSRWCLSSMVSDRQCTASPCGTVHSYSSYYSASNCNHVNYSHHRQPSSHHECESIISSSRPLPCAKQISHLNNHHHHNHNHQHNHMNGVHNQCPPPPELQAAVEALAKPLIDQFVLTNHHNHAHEYRANHHTVDSVDAPVVVVNTENGNSKPPVPMRRTIRPHICTSPLPTLKRANRSDRNESDKKCKPSQYKRHMDFHVQTIFKYLADREGRRIKLEEEIQMRQQTGNTLDTEKDILEIKLKRKESRYLRSLRSPISPDDFVVIAKLGQGAMGSVSLVEKRSIVKRGELFAMKKIKKSQVRQGNHMAHIRAERDILAEADNEWLVKLHYSFQDDRHLYLIMEYLPGGDMIGLLQEQRIFSEDWARFYIAEIALAVQFVHDMQFVHRDIKPDNILIGKDGHIKLTDFGLCTGYRWTHDSKYYDDNTLGANGNSAESGLYPREKRTDDHMTITKELIKRELEHSSRPKTLSLVGSPNYIAPEVLRQACNPEQCTGNEKLCDWWSVGVILYEMVYGHCPFQVINLQNPESVNNSSEATQYRILNWKKFLGFEPVLFNSLQLSVEVIDLLSGLLCDPEDRLCQNGIRDLQQHPFFNGIDWMNIRSTEAPHKPKLIDQYDTSYFPKDNPLPEMTFNSLRTHGTITHFTHKAFWNPDNWS